jgi:hypothetical protein
MKWQYYTLKDSDPLGIELIRKNLSAGATNVLSQKLLTRLSDVTGSMLAVGLEKMDIGQMRTYSYATYDSGRTALELFGVKPVTIGDRPIDGLILFLTKWIQSCPDGLILIEDPISRRSNPNNNPECRASYGLTSRLAFHNEEVYYVVTAENSTPDNIEESIRGADYGTFVGVCARGVTVPSNNELSESTIAEVANATQHVFVPAFDHEGYLIWSLRPGSVAEYV